MPKTLHGPLRILSERAEGDAETPWTVEELYHRYTTSNAALTEAAKYNLDEMLSELKDIPQPETDTVIKIFSDLMKQETGRKIATIALDISNGQEGSLEEIRQILEQTGASDEIADPTPIDSDLEALVSDANLNTRWTFNIRPLRDRVKGIGPAIFTVIAARPEVGKTASWVSFCAAPEGFVQQGATIDCFLNEEKPSRVALRFASASTGYVYDKLVNHLEEVKPFWDKIRKQVRFYDASEMSLSDVERIVKQDKPDIVIVDQLDKVKIDGTFTRGDEELRELYKRARSLSKSTDTSLIAVSQISATGHGHTTVDYSMLEGSRTGKAAEADLIIAIGANSAIDNRERYLNLTKNKVSGNHEQVVVQLDHSLSRLTA